MKNRPALTLVELLLATAIIVVLSAGTVFSFRAIRENQALKLSADQLASESERVRIFSRESRGEKSWGIKGTSPETYTMISRDGTEEAVFGTGRLVRPAVFVDEDFEIWFDQVTGETEADTHIGLLIPGGGSRVIDITQFGLIEVR